MRFLSILLVVTLSTTTTQVDCSSKMLKSLEDDAFLQLLEVEIARTLRSEMRTADDDELQVLQEGSGLRDYLREESSSTSTTASTSTTTTTPATTTTTTTTVAPARCVPQGACYKDADCAMGGTCLGSELGVCDCNACVTNAPCTSDVECGGLRNACDANGYCDCVTAFHSHGYRLFVKVLLTFCHQTKCTASSDNCFGLPCRVGKCKCSGGAALGSNLQVHYFTSGQG